MGEQPGEGYGFATCDSPSPRPVSLARTALCSMAVPAMSAILERMQEQRELHPGRALPSGVPSAAREDRLGSEKVLYPPPTDAASGWWPSSTGRRAEKFPRRPEQRAGGDLRRRLSGARSRRRQPRKRTAPVFSAAKAARPRAQ